MHTKLIGILLNLLLAALTSANVYAATCSVAAIGVAFGNYDSSSNSDSTGTVTVSCFSLLLDSVSYTIALSKGSGQFSPRQLKSGSNTLNYNVYTTNARTTIWGNGTSSTSMVSDSYNIIIAITPIVRSYTAYGRIPASQNVTSGTYTDTLDVTVTY